MVLFPANDTYARFVSVHRAELAEDFVFRVPRRASSPPSSTSALPWRSACARRCPFPARASLTTWLMSSGRRRTSGSRSSSSPPCRTTRASPARTSSWPTATPSSPSMATDLTSFANDVPGVGPQRRWTYRRRQHLFGRRRPRPCLDVSPSAPPVAAGRRRELLRGHRDPRLTSRGDRPFPRRPRLRRLHGRRVRRGHGDGSAALP